ncbi:hypothetical protein CNY89_08995 [Amaricoccus sp. HAR-UPW-R2A-40]|nr:hypothetical protein CNY89_08995 [Amaricoccus sp. HAR-UPW-R2A-40]
MRRSPGTDGLLERNHLHGLEGDAVNAILCAVDYNCRLLLAWFRRLLACLITAMPSIAAGFLCAIAAIIKPPQAQTRYTQAA